MKLKKEKDLDQLKQALQDKTESYEKTKYSLERLTEEYMEGIIDWPIEKQQKQYVKKIDLYSQGLFIPGYIYFVFIFF